MKASFPALLMLLVPCVGLADTAPPAPTPAQMDVLHVVFAALHAARGNGPHHPGGEHHGPPTAGVETIHVDTTRNFAPADGSAGNSYHVVGDLSVQSSQGSDGPTHNLSGTLTTTDAQSHTSKVTLTAVSRSRGQHCMLPSGGTAALTAADGSTHAVTFTATCGQVTVDGASLTLPMPTHQGRGPDQE